MGSVKRGVQPVAIAPRGNVNQLWHSGGRSAGADNTGPFVHLPWLFWHSPTRSPSHSSSLVFSPDFSLSHHSARENNLQSVSGGLSVSHTIERQSQRHNTLQAHITNGRHAATQKRLDGLLKETDKKVACFTKPIFCQKRKKQQGKTSKNWIFCKPSARTSKQNVSLKTTYSYKYTNKICFNSFSNYNSLFCC